MNQFSYIVLSVICSVGKSDSFSCISIIHVVPNPYDLHSSSEHSLRYFRINPRVSCPCIENVCRVCCPCPERK